MPPVGAAIGAAATAIGASVSAALAVTALSGFALRAFTQIAIGVAFSAISRALAPKPKLLSAKGTPHWVRPHLVAQVRYTEITDDGRLRSFGTLDEPFAYAGLLLLGLVAVWFWMRPGPWRATPSPPSAPP